MSFEGLSQEDVDLLIKYDPPTIFNVIDIFEDVEYFVRLTSETGNPVGLWDSVAEEYIVEIDSGEMGRTVAYVFSEGDQHELFIRSRESEVPATFSFTFWIIGS